jgi:hypothetical protein
MAKLIPVYQALGGTFFEVAVLCQRMETIIINFLYLLGLVDLLLTRFFDLGFQAAFPLVLILDRLGFHHRIAELLHVMTLADHAVAHCTCYVRLPNYPSH